MGTFQETVNNVRRGTYLAPDFQDIDNTVNAIFRFANPRLTGVFLQNDSPDPMWIGIERDAVIGDGIRLNPNGGSVFIVPDFALPGPVGSLTPSAGVLDITATVDSVFTRTLLIQAIEQGA